MLLIYKFVRIFPVKNCIFTTTYCKIYSQKLFQNKSFLKLYTNSRQLHFTHKNFSEPFNVPTKKKKAKSVWIHWKGVAIVAVMCSTILAGMLTIRFHKEEEIEKKSKGGYGKPALGGPFDLIDFNEVPRKSEDFYGTWLLLYFGFVNCPDICPEELDKLCTVAKNLESDASLPKVQPIFISVDIRRDTPKLIKKYCAEFSPNLLGMTGLFDKVHEVAHAYRMYISEGPVDKFGDYLVDHSVFIFLVGPKGEFIEYFKRDQNADWVTAKVKAFMKEYGSEEKD